ncbi:hypothetical protein D3C87_1942310 [compost metagenome]
MLEALGFDDLVDLFEIFYRAVNIPIRDWLSSKQACIPKCFKHLLRSVVADGAIADALD